MRNNLSYLIKNTSAVFVIKIIGMGLAFLLQVILGKLLGVEGFGQYTMFITTLNLLVLFTVVGIDNCLIRTIPRIDSEDKLKWRLLRNSIFTTVVLFIIILLLSTMFKDKISLLEKVEDKRVYLIVFLTLIMSSISKVIDGFFQGEKKTLVTTTFSILLSNMLKILLFLLFYFVFNIGILNAIISYSLSELILLVFRLIYLSFVKKNTKTTKDTIYTKKDYIKFLKYSIALFAISGTTVLVHSLDKIMINYYVDTASVGMYKVAESYLGLITVSVTPFVVFWPMISNLYKEKNIDELKRLLSFVNKIIALISIPVIVMMIIFSKELFLIFGKNFTKGNGILYILLIGTVFDALTGPMGAVLNMTDYAKFSLFNTTFVAIL
ncbi:MAG: oligosaccharide flippase family protein, partial [Clostridiaceae bacterium]